jgi:DnaK suppressor protein
MQQRNDINIKNFRKKLLSRQKELEQLIDEHTHEIKPVEIDESQVGLLSRLEAIDAKAVSDEVEHKREDELKRVILALKHIDDGEYGYCMVCGEEIEEKRLALDPAVLACIDCART